MEVDAFQYGRKGKGKGNGKQGTGKGKGNMGKGKGSIHHAECSKTQGKGPGSVGIAVIPDSLREIAGYRAPIA